MLKKCPKTAQAFTKYSHFFAILNLIIKQNKEYKLWH